jgi:UDP-N-acetylmuramate dehydrogenase
VRDAVLSLRNTKLPDVKKIGSAGSFFKNPVILKSQYIDLQQLYPNLKIFPADEGKVKLSAAQLIELCGWKGFRQGDAGVYPQQALILVNYGQAEGKEIEKLSKDIQQSVYQKFNINLETEVLIL